jgi:hypothetical protein
MFHSRCKFVFGCFLACVQSGATVYSASAQHSDIEIEIEDGNVVSEPRIVEAEFGADLLPAFSLDEPGFEADDGALMPDDVVSIALPTLTIGPASRSIWHWNGLGAPAFGPSPHELKVTHPGTATSIQVNGMDPSVELGLAVADADGGLHQDLTFALVDAGGVGVPAPDDGVYLWATVVKVAGYTDSEPIYWLAGSGVDEAVVETAVDYVATQFGVIPEPTSFALLALASVVSGGLGLWRWVVKPQVFD